MLESPPIRMFKNAYFGEHLGTRSREVWGRSLGALDPLTPHPLCFALFTYQKNFLNETILLFLKQL